jgi:hypothetical protein
MSGFGRESYEGIRQYDIWIDGQKLSADFLPDRYTQVGKRLLLGFGDGQVSIRQGVEEYSLIATDHQENYAQLDRARIEFRLQDDANGRRVLISTRYKLQWAERFADDTQGPFEPFPESKCALVFGRTYVLRVKPEDDSSSPLTMTLRVTDCLAELEVGDSRSPSPVSDPPDSAKVLERMRRTLEKNNRVDRV